VEKSATHPKASEKKKVTRTTAKREREETPGGEGTEADQRHAKEARLVINTAPHRILFCQKLPAETTQESLTAVVQHIPGFREVRIVPGNRGLGFIEFENEVQSGIALRQLNGFQLTPTHLLNLTYSS
jgi:RNA recognition motif-containing protein